MNNNAPNATSDKPPVRPAREMRQAAGTKRILVTVGLIFVSLLLHAWWLPFLAYPIARCDSQPNLVATNPNLPNHLLLTRSTDTTLPSYDLARDFAAVDSSKRILILAGQACRAEQIGAVPDFAETTKRRLRDMGVSDQQLIVIGERNEFTTEQTFVAARRWLANNSAETLLLPTQRFSGGLHSDAATSILSPQERERVVIVGLPCNGVHETNWWKNSVGLKLLINEYLALIHYRCYGEPQPADVWDPDEYEQQLMQLNRETHELQEAVR